MICNVMAAAMLRVGLVDAKDVRRMEIQKNEEGARLRMQGAMREWQQLEQRIKQLKKGRGRTAKRELAWALGMRQQCKAWVDRERAAWECARRGEEPVALAN